MAGYRRTEAQRRRSASAPCGNKLTRTIDLLAIEIYAAVAALSVEALCRLVDSAWRRGGGKRIVSCRRQAAGQRISWPR
jgi:hypothetical protein